MSYVRRNTQVTRSFKTQSRRRFTTIGRRCLRSAPLVPLSVCFGPHGYERRSACNLTGLFGSYGEFVTTSVVAPTGFEATFSLGLMAVYRAR